MSILDAIKKSVLEGFSSEITLADIIISLIVAFLSGLFIPFLAITFTPIV